ncbi:hypothetical protein GR130_33730 [Streptomyces sp. GS7]|nr:hypothetical protein GR130_33730 [Streptomyces sp. GS7]
MRERRLTRGARDAGGLVCLVLALLGAVWIARDAAVARRPAELWWGWLGAPPAPHAAAIPVTSLYDPLLVLGGSAVAIAVRRRAVAAPGALLALAAATVLLRIPQLWIPLLRPPGARSSQGVDGALADWAEGVAIAQLVLAAALFAVVAAGRRPVRGELSAVVPAAYGVVHEAPPYGAETGAAGRPRPGPARVAAVSLGAAALALIAGQLYRWRQLGWDAYREGLLGGALDGRALLEPPPHWQAAALALLALGAAVAMLRRARWARPAALAAGTLLLVRSAAVLALAVRAGEVARWAELCGAAVVALLGLAAVYAAARPGVRDAAADRPGPVAYGGDGTARPRRAPPPPSTLPPGW